MYGVHVEFLTRLAGNAWGLDQDIYSVIDMNICFDALLCCGQRTASVPEGFLKGS